MGKILLGCIVGIVLLTIGLWLRRAHLARGAAPGSNNRFVAIALLLKAPSDVSRQRFEGAYERAFGDRPAAESVITEAPAPAKFIIRRGNNGIAFLAVDRPYVDDPAAAVERLALFELKQVMGQHRAWMSVDFLGELPPGGKPEARQWVAEIAADLIDDNCIGIYSPETEELNVIRPDTVSLLRSADPLKAFEYRNPKTSVHVQGDDPDLAVAAAEAKRRWPEFVSAFAQKKPMQGFAVKAPFVTSGGGQEHIWVEVKKLDAQSIEGKLANEPNDIPGKKLGDSVTLKVEDVEDWIYQEGTTMVGAFSTKVLSQSRSALSGVTERKPEKTDRQVKVFLNPLIMLLAGAEKQKGRPLTRDEVLAVRDSAAHIMMSPEQATKFYQSLDSQVLVHRINPDRVWEEWQLIRAKVQ